MDLQRAVICFDLLLFNIFCNRKMRIHDMMQFRKKNSLYENRSIKMFTFVIFKVKIFDAKNEHTLRILLLSGLMKV